MPSILEQLPGTDQLKPLLEGKFGPGILGVDGLQGLDIRGLSASITQNVKGDGGRFALPALPASLSKGGFIQGLSQPLENLKSINSSSWWDCCHCWLLRTSHP